MKRVRQRKWIGILAVAACGAAAAVLAQDGWRDRDRPNKLDRRDAFEGFDAVNKRVMMERYDLDGDGVLSAQERQLAMQERDRGAGGKADRPGASDDRPRAMAQFRALLAHFDRDGDARLSAAERAAALQALTQNLDQHDADGDGALNLDEWLAARSAWQKAYGAETPL
jgi:hypothetical protein